MKLAARMNRIEGSATLAVTNKAASLKAQGIDVVGFGAGQPDFDTPQHIIDAAKRGLDDGWTRYTPTGGLPVLKNAIVDHVAEHFGLDVTTSEVMASCGGKHTLYNATQALIEPGDEVLLPAPYWVTYPAQISMAGGITRVVQAEAKNGFRVTPEAIEAAITPKTRGLILNSPSNPTGAGYRRSDLEGIAKVVEKHNLWVISDEMY
ncbi:MAG: aspartate aminotransferase, partial [Myxococcota bacterium]